LIFFGRRKKELLFLKKKKQKNGSSLFGVGGSALCLSAIGGQTHLVRFLGSAERGRFFVPA
jgi:hypothetical protein